MGRYSVPREEPLIYVRESKTDWTGVVIATAAGLGAGLMAGLLISDLFGNMDSDRFRQAVGRLRSGTRDPEEVEPRALEHAVEEALKRNPTTGSLAIRARALGEGIVEITGTVPDAEARSLAGDLVRGVDGARVVVNRVLVAGTDVPREAQNPQSVG
jgi:hypothetical protein